MTENTEQNQTTAGTTGVGTSPPAQTDRKPTPGVPGDPTPRYFNAIRHARVESLRNRGIYIYLGERWGDLEVCMRDLQSEAVVTAREAKEDEIRMQLGLTDDDKLPNEAGAQCTKTAVATAITGARGTIEALPEMLEIARRHGWQIAGERVTLTGHEDGPSIATFFRPLVTGCPSLPPGSWSFTTTLVRMARGLKKVDDEVIDRLGKDFVYGRHLGAELLD